VLRTESAGGFRKQRYPVVAGDPTTFQDRFASGEAVLVSDNFAYRHGLHAGDTLSLDTPSGQRTFAIAAVVLDYTLDIGTIIMERETYRRLWQDDLVNSFRVWLAPGANRETVRQAIANVARPEFTITVLTASEFKQNVARALDDALLMTYAIQLVAIVIAVIGVINFFLAETVDRRREIGLLRSVALSKGQVLRVLSVEALIIGMLGGVLGVLYAWPIAHALVTQSTRLVSGWGLMFVFPVPLAFVTVALAAATSVLAALYPARAAAATSVADLVLAE
jgi:putative ABC transport system permease protein